MGIRRLATDSGLESRSVVCHQDALVDLPVRYTRCDWLSFSKLQHSSTQYSCLVKGSRSNFALPPACLGDPDPRDSAVTGRCRGWEFLVAGDDPKQPKEGIESGAEAEGRCGQED
nr:hypothetical protein CFP56_09143 [Quercus suber]